jgi:hypothetical protein
MIRADEQFRFRHRESLGDLHQYVIEQEDEQPIPTTAVKSTISGRVGPKIIKLDDDPPPA